MIFHPAAEDETSLFEPYGTLQDVMKPVAVKDVVAEDQADVILSDKLPCDHKCLRYALRFGLNGIGKPEPQGGPVPEKALDRGRSSGLEMRRIFTIVHTLF